jgi:hypothetical protein
MAAFADRLRALLALQAVAAHLVQSAIALIDGWFSAPAEMHVEGQRMQVSIRPPGGHTSPLREKGGRKAGERGQNYFPLDGGRFSG